MSSSALQEGSHPPPKKNKTFFRMFPFVGDPNMPNRSPECTAENWSFYNLATRINLLKIATDKLDLAQKLSPDSPDWCQKVEDANRAIFDFNKYPNFFGESPYTKAHFSVSPSMEYDQEWNMNLE